ncbi:MAG: hypothetical protein P4L76_11075 [Beijerinckiaceae bacterium]|nr:hypothetical protein [Beijerinckiaceae bacterium]
MKAMTAEVLSTILVLGLALAQAGDYGTHAPAETATPDTDVAKKSGSLSDKLNSSNGVIHPQGVTDPTMQKPAIAHDPMPVIPPPSASGQPSAQPK